MSSSLCRCRVHLKSLNALVTGSRGVLGISAGRGAHPVGLRLSKGPHITDKRKAEVDIFKFEYFWIVVSRPQPQSDSLPKVWEASLRKKESKCSKMKIQKHLTLRWVLGSRTKSSDENHLEMTKITWKSPGNEKEGKKKNNNNKNSPSMQVLELRLNLLVSDALL